MTKDKQKEPAKAAATRRKSRSSAFPKTLRAYRRLLIGFALITLIQLGFLAWAAIHIWKDYEAQQNVGLEPAQTLHRSPGAEAPDSSFPAMASSSQDKETSDPNFTPIPLSLLESPLYEEHLPSLPAIPPSQSEAATSSSASPASEQNILPWQAHAVAVPQEWLTKSETKLIAIVIDDVGIGAEATADAIALPPPITLSFLSYASGLPRKTAAARAAGHELMVHLPMEPSDPMIDPGPEALMTGLTEAELRRRTLWALGRFTNYVGVNNHMGSKFTTDSASMAAILRAVHDHGVLFLDSKTASDSVGFSMARSMGIPALERDVFLDNEANAEAILNQLHETERIAMKKGAAIAIGHPYPVTLDTLRAWIPEARSKGFYLVPVSAILRQKLATEKNQG